MNKSILHIERSVSSLAASTSGRGGAIRRPLSRPRSSRLQVHATSSFDDDLLDAQAEKQAALMKNDKQKKKSTATMREIRDLTKVMPDPASDDNLLADDDSIGAAWATAAAAETARYSEGSDSSASPLSLGALQSIPYGELEAAELAAAATEGLPTYRNPTGISGAAKSYGNTSAALPSLAAGVNVHITAQQAAIESFLMEQAVDEGMKLHHRRLEDSHSRYATSLRFAELLEEVEMEDVRRGAAPLLAGTHQKMPSWIRASENLAPEIPAINEMMISAEIAATEAELLRVRDSILDEVEAAARLLAETDPQAGISMEELPASAEALDELFWDDATLLPGIGTEVKEESPEEGGEALLTQFLKEILPDPGTYLEFAELGGGRGGVTDVASSLQALTAEVTSVLEDRAAQEGIAAAQSKTAKTADKLVEASSEDEEEEEEDLEGSGDDLEGTVTDTEAWEAAGAATGQIMDD